jgi:hypothetical protein
LPRPLLTQYLIGNRVVASKHCADIWLKAREVSRYSLALEQVSLTSRLPDWASTHLTQSDQANFPD